MTTVPPGLPPKRKPLSRAPTSPRPVTGSPGASYYCVQKPCSDRRRDAIAAASHHPAALWKLHSSLSIVVAFMKYWYHFIRKMSKNQWSFSNKNLTFPLYFLHYFTVTETSVRFSMRSAHFLHQSAPAPGTAPPQQRDPTGDNRCRTSAARGHTCGSASRPPPAP